MVEETEESVVVRIKDFGRGINTAKLKTIFDGDGYQEGENGKQDSYKGMGSGLSICRTIILAHGGALPPSVPSILLLFLLVM